MTRITKFSNHLFLIIVFIISTGCASQNSSNLNKSSGIMDSCFKFKTEAELMQCQLSYWVVEPSLAVSLDETYPAIMALAHAYDNGKITKQDYEIKKNIVLSKAYLRTQEYIDKRYPKGPLFTPRPSIDIYIK